MTSSETAGVRPPAHASPTDVLPWRPGDVVLSADQRLSIRAREGQTGDGRWLWHEGVDDQNPPQGASPAVRGGVGPGPAGKFWFARMRLPLGGLYRTPSRCPPCLIYRVRLLYRSMESPSFPAGRMSSSHGRS